MSGSGTSWGLEATGVEAVLYAAVLKDVGCGASGAALAPFLLARDWPSGSATASANGREGR
jgi:hypothetical protein